MKKTLNPEQLRDMLIALSIVVSYVTFLFMGIVLAKHQPKILLYTDFFILPLALYTVFFMFLFYMTSEKKIHFILDEHKIKAAKLYSKGESIYDIRDKMDEFNHVEQVRRAIKEYIKYR